MEETSKFMEILVGSGVVVTMLSISVLFIFPIFALTEATSPLTYVFAIFWISGSIAYFLKKRS